MASAKLVFLCAVMGILAGLLDAMFIPTKEVGINLEEPNRSKRKEVDMIVNPGTNQDVVMGPYPFLEKWRVAKPSDKICLNESTLKSCAG